MKRILVAMSGGVDSAVAALLLQEQGYDIAGATMELLPDGAESHRAGDVCRRLGIDHHVFDLKDAFREHVMEAFAAEYMAGRTPNPCIQCNRFLKFGLFLDRALALGFEGMATGHYARVEHGPEFSLLKKAVSAQKDQSYVLYHLTRDQLSRTLFPLGEYEKDQVRQLARSRGFANSEAGESQDICFLPNGEYAAFVEARSGPAPAGDFVYTDGRVIGRHRGLHHYTIGQRKGLGIAWEHPLYVVAKDAAANRVVLGREEALYRPRLEAGEVSWIVPPVFPLAVTARTRYHQKESPALVEPLGDDAVSVIFDSPVRAPAPGQAVVFYRGDIVLGGGTIR